MAKQRRRDSLSVPQKALVVGVFLIVVSIVGGYFLSTSKNSGNLYPMPTRTPESAIVANSDGFKQVSFPHYNVTVNVPVELMTAKEQDPEAPYSDVMYNYVALSTSDSVISEKSGYKTKGATFTIKVDDTWTGFQNREKLANDARTTIEQSDSVIPLDNDLVTADNTRTYSYVFLGDQVGWNHEVEVQVNNSSTSAKKITLRCIDYGLTVPSERCLQFLTTTLATLKLSNKY